MESKDIDKSVMISLTKQLENLIFFGLNNTMQMKIGLPSAERTDRANNLDEYIVTKYYYEQRRDP